MTVLDKAMNKARIKRIAKNEGLTLVQFDEKDLPNGFNAILFACVTGDGGFHATEDGYFINQAHLKALDEKNIPYVKVKF